ncbi:polyphenol oxidase family protein [Candidatus Babeliales bacterium]|nr:polyphenol oxidase family protein [Candidatus Babeliales bacterium]
MIIKKQNYSIFFGDMHTCPVHYQSPGFPLFCEKLRSKNALRNIVLLKQVHGVDGMSINATTQLPEPVVLYPQDGDYLLTDQVGVGLAVLTADCMPVVLCDVARGVVGIAHAGWRGTVTGVVVNLVEHMQQAFGCLPSQLQVYFGPSARTCCYQVQPDFRQYLEPFAGHELLLEREGKLFFDQAACNKFQLVQAGVVPENIDTSQHICTICDHRFHSFRRQKAQAGRNVSVVWLPSRRPS